MKLIRREEQEEIAHDILSDDAAFSDETEGRDRTVDLDQYRNEFQRDRDKIVHCKSFRRLSHKTQVFLAPEGDHYRTRLTHTLEVAQISRTIARALGLNEDLAEAIALGHDLGHTPFGHAGETGLSHKLASLRGLPIEGNERLFSHNKQSLRVVEVIENDGKGLNLTPEVRDGIVCHTGSEKAETLEGRIVATSDRIAYVNHDIDDAIRAGIIDESDLPASSHAVLGPDHSSRIATLVGDMIETSAPLDDIRMSSEVWDAMNELRDYLFANVYRSSPAWVEIPKATHLVEALFDHYMANEEEIPLEYREVSGGDLSRAVCDYIAGMTDRFAKREFEKVYVPHNWRKQ